VVLDGEILGVLNCESKQRDAYGRSHLDLLRLVARLIAPHLEELLVQAGMRTRFAQVFRKVNSLLVSVAPGDSPEESDVLSRIARVIARSVHSPGCAIWLLSARGSTLAARGAFGAYQLGRSHDRNSGAARWLAIDAFSTIAPGRF
jgi:hypothetical protein